MLSIYQWHVNVEDQRSISWKPVVLHHLWVMCQCPFGIFETHEWWLQISLVEKFLYLFLHEKCWSFNLKNGKNHCEGHKNSQNVPYTTIMAKSTSNAGFSCVINKLLHYKTQRIAIHWSSKGVVTGSLLLYFCFLIIFALLLFLSWKIQTCPRFNNGSSKS